jgi:hypothetical protein
VKGIRPYLSTALSLECSALAPETDDRHSNISEHNAAVMRSPKPPRKSRNLGNVIDGLRGSWRALGVSGARWGCEHGSAVQLSEL